MSIAISAMRLAYCLTTLAIFSYVVFVMNAQPTWFVFMVVLDVLFYAYSTPYKGDVKAVSDGR